MFFFPDRTVHLTLTRGMQVQGDTLDRGWDPTLCVTYQWQTSRYENTPPSWKLVLWLRYTPTIGQHQSVMSSIVWLTLMPILRTFMPCTVNTRRSMPDLSTTCHCIHWLHRTTPPLLVTWCVQLPAYCYIPGTLYRSHRGRNLTHFTNPCRSGLCIDWGTHVLCECGVGDIMGIVASFPGIKQCQSRRVFCLPGILFVFLLSCFLIYTLNKMFCLSWLSRRTIFSLERHSRVHSFKGDIKLSFNPVSYERLRLYQLWLFTKTRTAF